MRFVPDPSRLLKPYQDIQLQGPAYTNVDVIPIFPQRIVSSAPYPVEQYDPSAFGDRIQPYTQQQERIYPAPHTPTEQYSPIPDTPEWRTAEYNSQIDRIFVSHAIENLFGENMADGRMEDVASTGDWLDINTDSQMTEQEFAIIMTDTPGDSTADDIPEIDQVYDSSPDAPVDIPAVEMSPAVGSSLDDILDDTVDDANLEYILGETMDDSVPEDEMPEMDPDMEPIQYPVEVSHCML